MMGRCFRTRSAIVAKPALAPVKLLRNSQIGAYVYSVLPSEFGN
jgi:hypothetical protein